MTLLKNKMFFDVLITGKKGDPRDYGKCSYTTSDHKNITYIKNDKSPETKSKRYDSYIRMKNAVGLGVNPNRPTFYNDGHIFCMMMQKYELPIKKANENRKRGDNLIMGYELPLYTKTGDNTNDLPAGTYVTEDIRCVLSGNVGDGDVDLRNYANARVVFDNSDLKEAILSIVFVPEGVQFDKRNLGYPQNYSKISL